MQILGGQHYRTKWRTPCAQNFPMVESSIVYWISKNLTQSPLISGQRESFFQSRDENESFSDSISFIETRPRIPDTYSQASRRDREKISSNLGHRDEIEIYYLHSQTSRREREFPWSDLVFRDETEKKCPTISSIETRLRFIINILRLRDEIDLISVFETRTRILKVAIFPWIQAWTASLFCMQFLGGCYIKCRALHFAWCSPILKWPSHVPQARWDFSIVAINAIK